MLVERLDFAAAGVLGLLQTVASVLGVAFEVVVLVASWDEHVLRWLGELIQLMAMFVDALASQLEVLQEYGLMNLYERMVVFPQTADELVHHRKP